MSLISLNVRGFPESLRQELRSEAILAKVSLRDYLVYLLTRRNTTLNKFGPPMPKNKSKGYE